MSTTCRRSSTKRERVGDKHERSWTNREGIVNRRRRYDAVVIGAGTAGLVAGIRLAQAGARVCVVAKGFGSTHLAPGTIDVLGYAPERVDNPAHAIAALAHLRPDHPYAHLGPDLVGEAVDWLTKTAGAGPAPGYGYVGSLARNFLLPTALGALKPSAVIPRTFAAGDSLGLGRLAVVGVPALRDFHAGLCAANLEAAGIDARAVTLKLTVERADSSTLEFARLFDDPAWRASFAATLAPLIRAADQVALPAMLGLNDPYAVLHDLEQRLGRRVFEVPTLPPSVPGMRLFEILSHALRAAGGRIALGAGVVAHERDGDRIVSIDTQSAGSPTTYEADAFVLASGGFHSGAITLDSRWQAHERVLGLPLQGVPGAEQPRFSGSYSDEQPLARVGVAVDAELRALGTSNVVVAGASLPGAVPWHEASGEGIALASGYRAAQVLTGRLSKRTQALR
jgi:glycerol-3-phosphate dehydrogenase subunit B